MMRLAATVLVVMFTCACQCRVRVVQSSPGGAGIPPGGSGGAGLPQGPAHDIIALLTDPETRKVGRVFVSAPFGGTVELKKKGAATRVVVGQPPHAPFKLSNDQIQQLFGDAFAALPPTPRHTFVYFESGSDQLTPQSERQLTEFLTVVKNWPVPDVTVVGHTDTVGTAQANIDLGRSRATLIGDRLVAAGLDGTIVLVTSHGEADLLVQTPDETAEPRNRRVEVSVR